MKHKYNWKEIQAFYDSGKTWKEITSAFGCAPSGIFKAVNRGDLNLRSKEESIKNSKIRGNRFKKHSTESKLKISNARLKFLRENPDKVPYIINHSSKKSWPETIFETALISS